MTDDYIVVIAEDSVEDPDGGKGIWGDTTRTLKRRMREVQLHPDVLEAKMSSFLHMVGRLFQRAEQDVRPQSGLRLEEVELSVEIGAEGDIKLVAAGGKAAGKGSITLTFKRPT